MLSTPVIFIIYNRPDLTERVFAQIRRVQPTHLYVIADGPRPDREHDAELCHATRDQIRVDWPCELHLDYCDRNLGCQQRIHSGLSRAFERYDRAIILEDDCLPALSLFTFCEAMLDRYANDEAVMHINGSNFVEPQRFKYSYGFTQYSTPWGWATWRRAWSHMDLQMKQFLEDPDFYKKQLKISRRAFTKLIRRLEKVRSKTVDSWAYPWLAANIAANGRALTPKQNLISNIGFDARSTHTKNSNSFFANRDTGEFNVEQSSHPISIEIDRQLNREVFGIFFGGKYRKKWSWRKWMKRRK
jgi:hypothetical protein